MADLRVRTAVFIVDPVTNANVAGVNANDNLQVHINEAIVAGGNTIGNVNLAEHTILDDDPVGVNGPVLMTGLVFDDAATVVVEEGDAGYQRMSLNRNAYTTIRDAAGSERGVNVTAGFEMNVIATAQPGVDIGDVDVASLPTSPDTVPEDDAFTAGLPVFPMGAQFDDVGINTMDENDIGAPRMSANRNLYGTIRDAAGNERGANVTGSNELNVLASAQPGVDIGDVDILSIIPGVGATNLGKAESATHVTGDTGVAVWGVRNDAETLLAADGEYIPFMMSSAGRVLVETQGGAGGTSETDSDPFTVATDLYVPVGGIFDDVAPGDLTEGDGGAVRMSAVREMYTNIRDGAGGERSANVTAAFELNVIASAQPGVDIGDVTIADGPTGASALEVQGTVAELSAVANNPFLMAGDDGTNVRHLTVDAAGHLQVDVLTGGGSDTPTTPLAPASASTDTAAAAEFDVDTADQGAATKKLAGLDFGASVPCKAEIFTVDNDVEVSRVVLFAKAGETVHWRPPHRDYYILATAGSGGFDGYRATLTNLDNSEAANLYGTIYTED